MTGDAKSAEKTDLAELEKSWKNRARIKGGKLKNWEHINWLKSLGEQKRWTVRPSEN